MEEPVNVVGGLMEEVVAAQRLMLARANVLPQVRSRPPLVRKRLFSAAHWQIPRLRFAIPTLAAAGAVALWWGMKPTSLTFAVGASAAGSGRTGAEVAGTEGQTLQAPADRPLPLRFSDGSEITLEQGARVQVASLDARGATLQIDKGRAEVNVRHRRQTHWKLRAGSFEVAVTGTRFSMEWEAQSQALTVVMAEGTVQVSGSHLLGGSPIVVTTGQKFHATTQEPRWTLATATAEPAAVASRSGPLFDIVPTAVPAAVPAPPPASPSDVGSATMVPAGRGTTTGASTMTRWQVLARGGRYQEALRLVERSGFERACARLGAEDLVQLGDAARLARNPARAEQAYNKARKRFPAADRPAFALGLVAFEQRRDFRGAARWFDLYARKYPNGPLATEAVGREMESWHRAGEAGRAVRAAREYLGQAPTGPYAPLARQIATP